MKILEMLRTQLAGLEAERKAAADAANSIAEKAETEERAALTEDEDTAVTAHLDAAKVATEKMPALRARIAELEELERDRAEANRRTPPVPGAGGKPEDFDPLSRFTPTAEVRARALSYVEQSRSYLSDDHKESVTKLIEMRSRFSDEDTDTVGTWAAKMAVVYGDPAYARAWAKEMRGAGVTMSDEERRAFVRGIELQRAMTSGTGSSGGYFVPTPLDPSMIITGAGSSNPFRQVCRIVTLVNANTWKGVSVAQVSASWDGEGTAVSDDAPTATQPSIPVYTQRVFVPGSFEAFEDIDSLGGDIAELMIDAKDNLEATAFATGSGSSQPTGVYTAVAAVTASRISATTGGAFAVADIYALHTGLPARHRNGRNSSRAWVTNVKHINSMRQFATANNYHAFLTDLGGGQPSQLLGEQLVESSAVTQTVTTGNDILLFGRMDRMVIVDRLGTMTEFIPNLFDQSTGRPSGQRGWLMHARTGANVTDADAFRILRL